MRQRAARLGKKGMGAGRKQPNIYTRGKNMEHSVNLIRALQSAAIAATKIYM